MMGGSFSPLISSGTLCLKLVSAPRRRRLKINLPGHRDNRGFDFLNLREKPPLFGDSPMPEVSPTSARDFIVPNLPLSSLKFTTTRERSNGCLGSSEALGKTRTANALIMSAPGKSTAPFRYWSSGGSASRQWPSGCRLEQDYCRPSYIPECLPTSRLRFAWLSRKLH
jgi:hypothetical protein